MVQMQTERLRDSINMIRTENIKKLSGNESTACFSNGENYTFSTEELCAFHIREGREYTQEEYETLIHNVTVQRAKLIVMPYVIYTKRTEKDRKKTHGKFLRTIQISSPHIKLS